MKHFNYTDKQILENCGGLNRELNKLARQDVRAITRPFWKTLHNIKYLETLSKNYSQPPNSYDELMTICEQLLRTARNNNHLKGGFYAPIFFDELTPVEFYCEIIRFFNFFATDPKQWNYAIGQTLLSDQDGYDYLCNQCDTLFRWLNLKVTEGEEPTYKRGGPFIVPEFVCLYPVYKEQAKVEALHSIFKQLREMHIVLGKPEARRLYNAREDRRGCFDNNIIQI